MATISEALTIGLDHHRAGRLQAAEQIYRQILQADPTQAEALHLLGVIAHQAGKQELAAEYMGQAIRLKGEAAHFHSNLAKVHQAMQRIPEAAACCRRALELNPDYAEAHDNLGVALKEEGRLEEAIACFRRAVELKPDFAGAHSNLGVAFMELGNVDQAVVCDRRALELKPDVARAHNHLGIALMDQGNREEAVTCFRRALELEPHFAQAYNNLGVAFREQGRLDEAVACCRQALEQAPDFAGAHYNLGNAFKDQWKLDEAAACFQRALELEPGFAEARNSLGAAFMDQGKLDEAIACFQRALELRSHFAEAQNNLAVAFKDASRVDDSVACSRRAIALEPDNDAIHSNLILTLHYHPAHNAETIHEEHSRWNRRFAEPLGGLLRPHSNDRDPERSLRIGYVSPDFRDHVAGRYALPLIEQHDHGRFKVFCYASVAQPDALTQRFQQSVDVWRNIAGAPNRSVVDLVRADRIDILVDLAMHMARGRLPVFACKPAPVQICWLAYPGTSGLSAIDYRLTDPYLEPPQAAREYSAEEPVRLPHSFWCYDPPPDAPPVNPPPGPGAGRITFGSLNNYCKVNEGVIALWSEVLCAVEQSRLALLSKEGAHRERALKVFEQCGVASDRIEWLTPAVVPRYLRYYSKIDIGLDTFPYNGHTTSLDSFWMGVPVVTLVGRTVVGRAGLSLLMNLGLPELIAFSPEQYVHAAAALAEDLPRLSELRATLRDRMRASPLTDAARFARNVEAAYRQMWRRWCKAGSEATS